jgi:hypothetical protein
MTSQQLTGTINILDQRINIRRFVYSSSYTKRAQHVLKVIFNNGHFSKTIFTLIKLTAVIVYIYELHEFERF